MTHRTQVLPTRFSQTDYYVPVCSCGWAGDNHTDRTEAAIAANNHNVDAMRKGVKVSHLGEPEVKTIKR